MYSRLPTNEEAAALKSLAERLDAIAVESDALNPESPADQYRLDSLGDEEEQVWTDIEDIRCHLREAPPGQQAGGNVEVAAEEDRLPGINGG